MIRFSFPIKLWSSKSKTHENWNCTVFLQFTGTGAYCKNNFQFVFQARIGLNESSSENRSKYILTYVYKSYYCENHMKT